jgi:hypothetical protein
MAFEVTSVCYEAIGDEAKIVIIKDVVGHQWRIEATFPLQAAGRSEQGALEQQVREEARRVLLDAADSVFN